MEPINFEVEFDQNGQLPKNLFTKLAETYRVTAVTIQQDNNPNARLTIQYHPVRITETGRRVGRPSPLTISSDRGNSYLKISHIKNFKVKGNLNAPMTVPLKLTNPWSDKFYQVNLVLQPKAKTSAQLGPQVKSTGLDLFGSK